MSTHLAPTRSAPSRLRRSGLTRTVAAAAVAASTALVTAQAGIIYSGVVNTSITASSPAQTATFNVDPSTTAGSFTLSAGLATDKSGVTTLQETITGGNIVVGGSSSSMTFLTLNKGSSAVNEFLAGQAISHPTGGGPYQAQATPVINAASGGTWVPGTTGYIGFLYPSFGVAGPLNFGWAELTMSADSNTLTLVDYAYDNSGASILAGDKGIAPVPEPATTFFGLACLGALGLRRQRRA